MKALEKIQSICPICQKPIEAEYVEKSGKVFMRKVCQDHGSWEAYVAGCVKDFTDWTTYPVVNVPPEKTITRGTEDRCPLNCGICDKHLQTACCVLIDVTERCNQQCPYCFAKSEQDTILEPDLAEIEKKYNFLLEMGDERPFNIHLSGGEPTLREDLPKIIGMGQKKGFVYIQINTNGRRLALDDEYAGILKEAGASVIYLQFDGTEDRIYQTLRGEPLLKIKMKAIENCRKARLPVVLVPTVVKNVNLYNIGSMIEFLLNNLSVVKGIHFQPVSFFGRYPEKINQDGKKWTDFENRVTLFDVMHGVEKQTSGKLKYKDFRPSSIGHTLCSFHASYRKYIDGSVKPIIDHNIDDSSEACCCNTSPADIMKKTRDYVLNKWNLPEQEKYNACCEAHTGELYDKTGCCGSQTMDFDQFINEMRSNMFTVTGMAFQDMSNLDAQRLKRCRVQVLSPDNRLIPFCAYNSLYRK
jgi:hypothetical protein